MAECSICFESIGTTNSAITECNHTFHLSCYKLWTKDTCPICRSIGLKNTNIKNILDKLPDLLQNDLTDKDTLLLYLNLASQCMINDVNPMYKAVILYNTRMLIDRFEDEPINYILKHTLYNLLDYYSLDDDDVQIRLIRLDNIKLIKYIKFNETTLYTITKYGCLNLLKYYRDDITNEYYSDNLTVGILYKFNLIGIACTHGQIKLLPFLSKYLDINEPNDWNCTPLFVAIVSGSLDTVKWLVERGCDITILHSCGSSLLYFAIEKSQFSIANYLINKGAIVDSSIVRACIDFTDDKEGGCKILRRVLSLISKKDFYKSCVNTRFCSPSIIKHDVDKCWVKSWTYLQGACCKKNFESILLLLSYDSGVIHQSSEVCIHVEKHLLNDKFKDKSSDWVNYKTWIEWLYCYIIKPDDHDCDDHNSICFFSCMYDIRGKMIPICDYILKLIERGGPVSYKHQRKILKKMMKMYL